MVHASWVEVTDHAESAPGSTVAPGSSDEKKRELVGPAGGLVPEAATFGSAFPPGGEGSSDKSIRELWGRGLGSDCEPVSEALGRGPLVKLDSADSSDDSPLMMKLCFLARCSSLRSCALISCGGACELTSRSSSASARSETSKS